MVATIDDKVATEIIELWDEYEGGKSEVAKLVKDIDKFEMILQADTYEREHSKDLQGFFDSTSGKFKTEQIMALDDELRKQRDERIQ